MSNSNNNYNNRNYKASEKRDVSVDNHKTYSEVNRKSYSDNSSRSYNQSGKAYSSGVRTRYQAENNSREQYAVTVSNNRRNDNFSSQSDRSNSSHGQSSRQAVTHQNNSRQYPAVSKNSMPETRHSQSTSNGSHPQGNSHSGNGKKKKTSTKFKVILIAAIVLICGIFAIIAIVNVNNLKDQANDLKAEIKTAISDVKSMDPDALKASIEEINKTSSEMRETLSAPVWDVISIVPVYGKDVGRAEELLDVVDEMSEKLLVPLARQIKKNPLSAMKVDGGFDVALITSYIDFVKEVMPDIKSMTEKMSGISLKIKPGLVEEYAETLNSALDTFDSLEKYLDLASVMLTPDQDKLYLLVAQNSAEIRASDGFPGSVGTVRIQDGILTIGDFQSVYNVFESDEMCTFEVTNQEVILFGDQFAAWAHDACYNPDFGRVGEIWADSYESKNEENVNGIISLTPAIIQELLAVCGESVTLSDGTVLDGTNATKVLQHDLYYTYVSDAETAVYGDAYADELFAETAQQVMSIATSNLSSDNILGYVDILVNGAEDRTVLIWMKNESEEDIAEKCGFSGKLNSDPDNPVAGVYVSFADPCKLGWFLNIDTELSEPRTKSDGRLEYDVTVKFTNTITEDELGVYEYIIGSYGGSMLNYIYFFAPAEGIIYDFEASYDMYIIEDFYKDLALGYRQDVILDPGETITVKYKVITKEGVTTPLRIETTPTLQKYRQQN